MEYKGMVFFDIDGTIVDERQKIYTPTEKTKKAIDTLKKNGYIVGINTGRAKCYIPDLKIDFDVYITCNGAVVEVDDKVIYNSTFSKEEVSTLSDYMDKNGLGYAASTRERCYYLEREEEVFERFIKTYNMPNDYFVPIESIEDTCPNLIILTFSKEEELQKIQQEFEGIYIIDRHHQSMSADIAKIGVNKYSGIKKAAEYFGIENQNIYAFGDDLNDYDMIKGAGIGIAMTPHTDVLETVADYITGSVKEDGVYYALRHFKLI